MGVIPEEFWTRRPASLTSRIQLMQKSKYFLTGYVGVDKKMITYFKKQNTRAVTIFKSYPNVLFMRTGKWDYWMRQTMTTKDN
jgi:hypothetical protein